MTKHHGRDKKTAMEHLEDSLRRLRTDVIDLWQFHEVVYNKDPEMIFAVDGGIEAAELAKKQGKVRFIGFTGHRDQVIHLKMLAYGYPWDAVQMPMNVFDAHFKSFQKNVLPILVRRNIGVIIKAALIAARFSGRSRKRSLRRLATMDINEKDKEILFFRDMIEQLQMQVSEQLFGFTMHYNGHRESAYVMVNRYSLL